MNTRQTTGPRWRSVLLRALAVFTVLAMLLPAGAIAKANSASPFVGNWRATDASDGSEIRVSIAGPPEGPFRITWTEDYISFCYGGPGLVGGTGSLNDTDLYVLEAKLRVECKISKTSTVFDWSWTYQPAIDKLSSGDSNDVLTVWSHPGLPLGLRVNYGAGDWVESFYEAGHTAWVTVTDAELGVLATTQLITEPKDYWDGGTGFTSLDGVWLDPDGNPMEYAPDIQPGDWVFGWLDDGAKAQVQIGTITGEIDLDADSIQGTVDAPWFQDAVPVECLDWGSGGNPYENKDGGVVFPDGIETYSCSWSGEWDIQVGQAIGVAYSGPDGNWVANSFATPAPPRPNFVAYLPSNVEGYDWPLGSLVSLNINDGEYAASGQSEERPQFPEGATRVLFELGDSYLLKAGDYITMTDGITTKDTVVTNLAVTEIDAAAGKVSGIFDATYSLRVWLCDNQEPLALATSGNTWTATFAELPPGALVGATQNDQDDDGTSLDFEVPTTP